MCVPRVRFIAIISKQYSVDCWFLHGVSKYFAVFTNFSQQLFQLCRRLWVILLPHQPVRVHVALALQNIILYSHNILLVTWLCTSVHYIRFVITSAGKLTENCQFCLARGTILKTSKCKNQEKKKMKKTMKLSSESAKGGWKRSDKNSVTDKIIALRVVRTRVLTTKPNPEYTGWGQKVSLFIVAITLSTVNQL